MKRPLLVLLAIGATAAFGTWLVRTPNTQREILLACAGWVLGFWAAAAIQARGHRPARVDDDGEAADAEWHDDGEDPGDWDEDWDEDESPR